MTNEQKIREAIKSLIIHGAYKIGYDLDGLVDDLMYVIKEASTVAYKIGYKEGFEDCKQETLKIIKEKSDRSM